MKRKITLFALAGSIGGFGASGPPGIGVEPSNASAWRRMKPSEASMPVSATEVNAPPACQRNSRRVRPQKVFEGRPGISGESLMARLHDGGRAGRVQSTSVQST